MVGIIEVFREHEVADVEQHRQRAGRAEEQGGGLRVARVRQGDAAVEVPSGPWRAGSAKTRPPTVKTVRQAGKEVQGMRPRGADA